MMAGGNRRQRDIECGMRWFPLFNALGLSTYFIMMELVELVKRFYAEIAWLYGVSFDL